MGDALSTLLQHSNISFQHEYIILIVKYKKHNPKKVIFSRTHGSDVYLWINKKIAQLIPSVPQIL